MSTKTQRVCLLALFSGFRIVSEFSALTQTIPSRAPSPAVGPSDEFPMQVIVVRTAEEAEEILSRLNKGDRFAQLVREKSIDPSSEQGGFLGVFAPSALRAELRDALPKHGRRNVPRRDGGDPQRPLPSEARDTH